MVEYVEEAKMSRSCPYVLLLDSGTRYSQAFSVISGRTIEAETPLAAVDTCFKSFYVFDLHFPRECTPTWQFLQTAVFDMEGTVSPAVGFLRSQLQSLASN